MSASCEWMLALTSRDRNKYLNEILEVLCGFEKVTAEEAGKIFKIRDGKNFRTNKIETTVFTTNGEAKGIWGDNYLELTADVFIAIAQAAPKAVWTADVRCISESGGQGCESYAEAVYAKGKLEFKSDNYVDSVALATLVSQMAPGDDSYEAFCACYTVDDSVDEDTYDEYRDDDMEDVFFFNPGKNLVSKRHVWEISTYTIG